MNWDKDGREREKGKDRRKWEGKEEEQTPCAWAGNHQMSFVWLLKHWRSPFSSNHLILTPSLDHELFLPSLYTYSTPTIQSIRGKIKVTVWSFIGYHKMINSSSSCIDYHFSRVLWEQKSHLKRPKRIKLLTLKGGKQNKYLEKAMLDPSDHPKWIAL